MKPFSESSEQNKRVILEAIDPLLTDCRQVLEVASGTGQHAVYFAEQMPQLIWQPSDLEMCLPGIQQWIADSELQNILPPFKLDVACSEDWPEQDYDAIYSANSFHIMSADGVEAFFEHVAGHVKQRGLITVYGPFNYDGAFTSDSNARFDQWLKQRDAASGIKDFEWCNQLAEQAGFTLLHDIEMPHNNRTLCWQKNR